MSLTYRKDLIVLRYIALFSLILQPCFAYQTHENLYFAFDVSKNFLNPFNLKSFTSDDIFFIRGYADSTGEKFYNKDLSYRRAKTVKEKLISEYGVKEPNIKIVFHGEDLLSNYSNAQKRRVEIISGTASEMQSLLKDINKQATSTYDNKYTSARVGKKNDSQGENYEEVAVKDIDSSADTIIHTQEEETPLSKSQESTLFKYSEQGSALEEKEDKDYIHQGRYYVGFGVNNNVLNSTDRGTGNEAEWVSKGNYIVEAQYQFKYKNLWLGVNGSYHIQDYEVELNPNFIWDEETPNLLWFSLVSDYETNRWGLGFDLDYHQTSFIYETNFDVELIDVFMLGVSLRMKYKWFETQKWSSRFGLKLDFPLTGTDDIEPEGGLGYIGFIDLKSGGVFKNHDLNIKLYYGLRNYTNNQNDQKENIVGLLFSLDSLNWL